MLCGLLLLSSFVRFGAGLDVARALEAGDSPPDARTDATVSGRPAPRALIEALQRREERVRAREAALADREQALAVVEKRVRTMLEDLVSTEEKLADTIAVADRAAEEDIARLTAVYGKMDAGEAAALFEQMAPEFAAGFLSRMRPEAAAGVMAALPPETAHSLSVVLAGRNARAPRK